MVFVSGYPNVVNIERSAGVALEVNLREHVYKIYASVMALKLKRNVIWYGKHRCVPVVPQKWNWWKCNKVTLGDKV